LYPFNELEDLPAGELLGWALTTFGREFAISTSFQKEGMAIIDMAARITPEVRVLTLDTGRLPEETHGMIEEVRRRYGVAVEVVVPEAAAVEEMVTLHGTNLFYRSVELRTRCCDVRKVRPLDRKLRELKAWASGLRRSQGALRASVRKVEQMSGNLRLSPLADWTKEQVAAYTREHGVPVHPLYARGYASIGCGPCTRAIAEGEPERAGRWWWEEDAKKECGIHFTPDGGIQRGLGDGI
jgi:phosphoadenosine phosphosulfate reductase